MSFRFRWRIGFYVAGEDGCVGNFMELLDEFLVWKSKAIQKDHVEVVLYLISNVFMMLMGH